MSKILMVMGLAVFITLSGISDRAGATEPKSSGPPATKPAHGRATADDFTLVPSDEVLKQVGQTRAQWNRKNPKSERRWRAAWAALGSKTDTVAYVGIRRESAASVDGGS